MNIYEKGKSYRAFFAFFILFILLFIPFNSFAEPKIPGVKHSVKPLDLSRTPTTEELMAAGQLGGQLHPTDDIQINDTPGNPTLEKGSKGGFFEEKIKRNREINLSFGQAIQEWNKHNYKEAVKMFRKHVEEFPDSPWASESELHVGCDATYNGRYTEAEGMFTKIINDNKDRKHEGAKMLLNKARQRLANLKVIQSNFDEALKLFAELKKDSPDWRHRTYASHWIQRISQYKKNELALLNCGTMALANILKRDGRESEALQVMEMTPSSLKGNSIKDLKSIASQFGYNVEGLRLSVSDLGSISLPAILQLNAKNTGDRGHYWVLEKISNDGLILYDPQSGRRFHQSPDEFSRAWDGNALIFASSNNIPGKKLTENEMEKIYGTCCGVPRPENYLGDPQKNAANDNNQSCPSPNGSPIWKVNMVNLNLFVTDIPLWYEPPIGPPVKIQLSYNSQSAIANNEPFGNKWQFNYGSYLVVDTGGQVTIFMSDGKRDVYTPNGSGGYDRPYQVFNELTKITDNHFELRFPDDTVYVYNIPSGTNSLQPFLVEIRDAYGQSLTFGYDINVQLITITDAVGQATNLAYNTDGVIAQIADPFGRSATFEYDANRNLTKVTDMGGYWTDFNYDADVYLTKIENPIGKWGLVIEPSDGIFAVTNFEYPAPGDNMWLNYRITITNPVGGREEYYYMSEPTHSWYVSPRDYIEWFSGNENNLYGNAAKTEYYSVVFSSSGIGEITQKRSSEYPLNIGINYNYDLNGNLTSVIDYYGNTTKYTYNNMGRITSLTDPNEFVTNLIYAGNGFDLQEIQNGLGKIKMTYNTKHDVASIKDRLGNTTSFQYNSYGQLTQSTDALGIVTVFTYDSNNNLQEVSRDGNVLDTFTYDNIGRVDTHTDSTGLTLDYDYNNLNNVTKVTYPDGKLITYTYSGCCPRLIDSVTDRSGKITRYTHDAMKRLVEAVDPEGRTTKYEYDANGNIAKLIDPNSNVTTFEYDHENRLVRKDYADGKYERYGYYYTGLLKDKTDARGITTNYTYDQNYNLLTETYSDLTPGVTYAYDNYNRITQRQDGMGTFTYTYDLNSRLTNIDGPWVNDTITFQYDKIGQLKTLTPQAGQAINYNYDTFGRLTTIQLGTNTFTYGYTGVNPIIQSLTRPNGSVTEYLYNDPLKRLTEIANKTSAQAIIDKHVFTYNNLDLIGSETITTGTPLDSFTAGLKTYDYNKLNQLLSSTNPSESFAYDDDGNMTQGYTPEGDQFTATYDAENRLKTIQFTDNGSVVHRTEYSYSGDSLVAKQKKFDNGILVSETNFIRAGFLPVQERDVSNAVTREYTWGLNLGGGIGGLLNLKQSNNDYSYLYDGKGKCKRFN